MKKAISTKTLLKEINKLLKNHSESKGMYKTTANNYHELVKQSEDMSTSLRQVKEIVLKMAAKKPQKEKLDTAMPNPFYPKKIMTNLMTNPTKGAENEKTN